VWSDPPFFSFVLPDDLLVHNHQSAARSFLKLMVYATGVSWGLSPAMPSRHIASCGPALIRPVATIEGRTATNHPKRLVRNLAASPNGKALTD